MDYECAILFIHVEKRIQGLERRASFRLRKCPVPMLL